MQIFSRVAVDSRKARPASQTATTPGGSGAIASSTAAWAAGKATRNATPASVSHAARRRNREEAGLGAMDALARRFLSGAEIFLTTDFTDCTDSFQPIRVICVIRG